MTKNSCDSFEADHTDLLKLLHFIDAVRLQYIFAHSLKNCKNLLTLTLLVDSACLGLDRRTWVMSCQKLVGFL